MFFFIFYFNIILAEALVRIELPRSSEKVYFNKTRRILAGHEVGDTRPYMVYLRPASTATAQIQQNWLCGGVIIDELYILTSAACIEDVKHFYVVSGTKKWTSPQDDDECVKNGAKKAIWKCVPRSYVYDGQEFDNIRWMINDIAVVKVEEDFNFQRRIRGCDFVPQKIAYNNQSIDLEKPKTMASIAGWGSTSTFSDVIETAPAKRTASNSEVLLETDVVILTKKNCKKRWDQRYHYIIDKYMICGKDSTDTEVMSTACEQEVNCKELVYSEEDDEDGRRRGLRIPDPSEGLADGGQALRRSKAVSGGFCENDHGGPLVVGHGKTSMVIGVISANQVRDKTRQCYGPFLYTSVWNNRHLISCAIDKEMGATCRKLLRASRTQMAETYYTWDAHPDGPAKNEEAVRPKETNVRHRDTKLYDKDPVPKPEETTAVEKLEAPNTNNSPGNSTDEQPKSLSTTKNP